MFDNKVSENTFTLQVYKQGGFEPMPIMTTELVDEDGSVIAL